MLRHSRGFTLIQLLVTMAIVAVLVGVTLPILVRARAKAKEAGCIANLRQLYNAFQMYGRDYDDRLPIRIWDLYSYTRDYNVFFCPLVPYGNPDWYYPRGCPRCGAQYDYEFGFPLPPNQNDADLYRDFWARASKVLRKRGGRAILLECGYHCQPAATTGARRIVLRADGYVGWTTVGLGRDDWQEAFLKDHDLWQGPSQGHD